MAIGVYVFLLTSAAASRDGPLVDSGQRLGDEVPWAVVLGNLDGDDDLFVGFLPLLEGWDCLPMPNQVWFNTANE